MFMSMEDTLQGQSNYRTLNLRNIKLSFTHIMFITSNTRLSCMFETEKPWHTKNLQRNVAAAYAFTSHDNTRKRKTYLCANVHTRETLNQHDFCQDKRSRQRCCLLKALACMCMFMRCSTGHACSWFKLLWRCVNYRDQQPSLHRSFTHSMYIHKIVACVYVLGHTHVSHVCNDKTEVLLAYSFGFWWAAVGIVTHAYVSSIMFMLVMHTFSTFSRDCCVWTKIHETTDKCLISATCQLFILCLDSITLSTRWWWC
jgi:hypothetical protein